MMPTDVAVQPVIESAKTLRGRNIICFAGEDWWFHNPHSNLHLMKVFAKQNRVLFINSTGIKMPDFRNDRFVWKRVLNKLSSLARYLKRAEPNIYVLTPIALPFIGKYGKVIGRINKWLLVSQLNIVMSILKFNQPILWVTVPVVRDTVLWLRETRAQRLVYYCVDNVSQYPGVDRERMLDFELGLHRRADVSLFVNHRLLEERRIYNAQTFHIGHGVDYEHFAQAQQERLPIPEDLKRIPRPIVGYMGEINGLDFELVRYLAEQNPDVSFVFLGEIYAEIEACRLPNVHFLEKKPYSLLPNYLQCFSCCCLYYKTDDAFNQYRNPKKLLEYLSTGKPVISVDIHELREFDGLVSIADSYAEFDVLLRKALHEDPWASREKRIVFAKEQTWEAVAARATRYILGSEPMLNVPSFSRLESDAVNQ